MKENYTNKKLNTSVVFAILAMLFSFVLFFGVSGLVAEEKKSNIVVTPLSLEGTGTYSSPYLVKSSADLNNLCAYTNSGGNTKGLYFKLTSADLTESGALEVALTEPIGTAYSPFMGIFDGNDITITGATYATNAQGQAGIFGQIKNATIQNLTVKYSSTDTTATVMGGIVASAYSSSILNCTNKTNIYNTAGDAMVAGIVGYAHNLNIEYCTNEATIKCLSTGDGISSAGGIVGFGYNTNISYCKVSPIITPGLINGGGSGSSSKIAYRGGIAGTLSGGSTKESYNTATISCFGTDEAYAGGIIGKATNHTITNCFNRGNVSATANETTSSSTKLTDYATYVIKSTKGYAGGICGSGSSINRCYNTGTVSGGRELYVITVSHTITAQVVSSVRGSITAVTATHSDILSGTVSVVYKYNYNNICPQSSGSYVYTTVINNLKSDFGINLSTKMNSKYLGGSTSTTNGSFSLNVTNSSYLSNTYTGNTKGVATIKNKSATIRNYTNYWAEFTSLSVVLNYSASSLSLTHNYNQSTGSNYTTPVYSSRSASIISLSLSRESYKPTQVIASNIKSTTVLGTDKTLPSGFSSSVWAYSSLINDGYPHLVKNYWQDSAKA